MEPGKSIKPWFSRASSPSRVARFNSVSVIKSGFVKLFFKSVIAASRSAGFSELIRSSVVGVADGEGDGVALAGVLIALGVGERAGAGDCEGAGDCASAFAIIETPINAGQINRNIR